MFNFIFEGKIGDILAPVVPTNKLFLAIQHHRNNEIQGLWDTTITNPNVLSDGTQSPIHVACRYNNRYAVDFALSRGTNIQLPDQNGNTPLHYASRYGNLDMCKYVIEKGSKTHMRNKQNQTPYDVAENHLVRQYLLPLVLAGEREAAEATGAPIPGVDYGYGGGMAPYTTYVSAPPPPPPTMGGVYGPPPTAHTTFPAPPSAASANMQPPGTPNGSTFQSIPLTPGQDAPAMAPPHHAPPAAAIRNTENRSIVPDGFHSSASDPVLQQKYGHIIEVKNIAPPPTGPIGGGPSMAAPSAPVSYYSAGGQPHTGANIYSRYVAYDATTNSAVPNMYSQPPAVHNAAYPPSAAPYGAPMGYPGATPVAVPPSAVAPMAPGFYSTVPVQAFPTAGASVAPPLPTPHLSAPPSSSSVHSSAAISSISPPSGTAPAAPTTPTNPTVSRLTANKADLVHQASSSLAVEVPVPTFVPPILQTTPKQKSSDSMHSIDLLTSPEGEIINANASSSSIL